MNLSHRKSQLVTSAQLAALPEVLPRGANHEPVPHWLLAKALKVEAEERGYTVTSESFAVNAAGSRLFGVMDLMPPGVVSVEQRLACDERGLSIGFRNSTNSSMAIKIVAGQRVFVCDNMVLSGDMIALQRRNTVGLDLEMELREGFNKFLTHASTLDRQIARLQAAQITDLAAKAMAFDVFAARVVPVHLFDDVERFYFHPADDMVDCQPRTEWGLHNAFTRAMKQLPPATAFGATVALGEAFGLVEGERS